MQNSPAFKNLPAEDRGNSVIELESPIRQESGLFQRSKHYEMNAKRLNTFSEATQGHQKSNSK